MRLGSFVFNYKHSQNMAPNIGTTSLQIGADSVINAYTIHRPHKTFWSQPIVRHTMFAVALARFPLSNASDAVYGQSGVQEVYFAGDLVGNIYFRADYTALTPVDPAAPVHPTSSFGNAIIDYVRFKLSGAELDYVSAYWLEALAELHDNESHQRTVSIFKSFDQAQLIEWGTSNHTLYISLRPNFSFYTIHHLPLIALDQTQVHLEYRFRTQAELFELAAGGAATPTTDFTGGTLSSPQFIVQYIYLDGFERRWMGLSKLTYLLHQKRESIQTVSTGSTEATYRVDNSLPARGHIVFFQTAAAQAANRFFDFSGVDQGDDPISEIRVTVNGSERVEWENSLFFRDEMARLCCNRVPHRHFYVIPWGLEMFGPQAAGHFNYARVAEAHIEIRLQTGLLGEGSGRMFVLNLLQNVTIYDRGIGNVRFA